MVLQATIIADQVHSSNLPEFGNGAKNIASAVGEVFKLAKFFKGSKPKEIESDGTSTTITNNNGKIIIVNNPTYNIYANDKVVRRAISEHFANLANDVSVESFDLLDENNTEIVAIDHEDFNDIASDEGPDTPDDDKLITDERAILTIITLSFESKRKWEFY